MFKAVKRTEGVSTTDIVRNWLPPPSPLLPPPSLLNRNHYRRLYYRSHYHQVGRMLTCGMEHFVDDDEMRGNSAILILPANTLL
jgi:hypothetical protein